MLLSVNSMVVIKDALIKTAILATLPDFFWQKTHTGIVAVCFLMCQKEDFD
jgi:hypothetical protein